MVALGISSEPADVRRMFEGDGVPAEHPALNPPRGG